jgi:hypothetical protein
MGVVEFYLALRSLLLLSNPWYLSGGTAYFLSLCHHYEISL